MGKYNILFVHSSDEMYGADRILFQIVERLDRKKFEPIVVLPSDVVTNKALSIELKNRNVKVIHLKLAVLRRKYFSPFGSLIFLWRLLSSTLVLMYLIKKESVDLVHSHTAAVLSGALAARVMNKRHVWQTLEIIVSPHILRQFLAWFMPLFADKIVAASGPTKDHLCAGNFSGKDKVIVLHNGVDLHRFDEVIGSGWKVRQEWHVGSEQILIGMIGRFSHWKGQDYFLKVASLLSDDLPEARFALVGGVIPGQEMILDNLKEFVSWSNLKGKVVFDDFRDDIPSVLDAYDIFILPSTSPDPFPTVVLEAMATGKPVVANAHGGSIEMIADGVTGLLVTPDEPQKMASAIKYLIDNPTKRATMGQQGRKRLETLFSLDTFVENWTSLYQELLDE